MLSSAFLDYRLYLFVLIYSGLSLSLAVVSIFLPTIVGDLGYKAVSAKVMTVPVYTAAYALLLTTAYLSDRFHVRGFPIIVASFISGAGYLVLGLVKDNSTRYGACFMAVSGTYMAFPIVLAWILSTFAADTKGGVGVGVVIAVTHAVGVAASNIFPAKQGPQYFTGTMVTGALAFTATLSSLVMVILLNKENCRRDRIYGKPERGTQIHMSGDADKTADFRYEL